MEEFERLLEAVRPPVKRFVQFRINSQMDADDVLQEVFWLPIRIFPAADKAPLSRGFCALRKINATTISGGGRKRRRSLGGDGGSRVELWPFRLAELDWSRKF